MLRLNDLDGTSVVLLVFVIVGAWRVAGWTIRAMRHLLRPAVHCPRFFAGKLRSERKL